MNHKPPSLTGSHRGTLFWGPYNKDPTIWGTILGSPIFGNSHMGTDEWGRSGFSRLQTLNTKH